MKITLTLPRLLCLITWPIGPSASKACHQLRGEVACDETSEQTSSSSNTTDLEPRVEPTSPIGVQAAALYDHDASWLGKRATELDDQEDELQQMMESLNNATNQAIRYMRDLAASVESMSTKLSMLATGASTTSAAWSSETTTSSTKDQASLTESSASASLPTPTSTRPTQTVKVVPVTISGMPSSTTVTRLLTYPVPSSGAAEVSEYTTTTTLTSTSTITVTVPPSETSMTIKSTRRSSPTSYVPPASSATSATMSSGLSLPTAITTPSTSSDTELYFITVSDSSRSTSTVHTTVTVSDDCWNATTTSKQASITATKSQAGNVTGSGSVRPSTIPSHPPLPGTNTSTTSSNAASTGPLTVTAFLSITSSSSMPIASSGFIPIASSSSVTSNTNSSRPVTSAAGTSPSSTDSRSTTSRPTSLTTLLPVTSGASSGMPKRNHIARHLGALHHPLTYITTVASSILHSTASTSVPNDAESARDR
ncbi:Uu.00g103120.m01.CDS01 [Anthostomella pinea]|uniref:Uu.00g103120.m01.CDS01 n=1 Tax=Anthostomella pinea TaxID=933095 RepID=A0AAI8VE70_9PEZI|nr:Uu.00g103120.m01.CDS01 [Anthostomella pinea]